MLRIDEKGMALPLILVCMLVLGLLGIALLQYSVTDAKQVARERDKVTAHYSARSGADAMAEYLIDNPYEIADIVANTSSFSPAGGSVGNAGFQVNVKDNSGIIEINSTGISNGIEETVTLILSQDNDLNLFSSAVAQTYKTPTPIPDLDLKQMNVISGVVESTGRITNYDGPKIEYSNKEFPPPSFPGSLPLAVYSSGNPIEPNHSYSTIYSNNDPVTFSTNGQTVKVMVDYLNVKEDIIIDGEGRLELYVKHSANLQTPKQYGNNPNQFIVYLAKDAQFAINSGGDFSGYIYGPEATITIQSEHTLITGAVVGKIVNRNSSQGPHGNIDHRPLNDDEYLPTVLAYERSHWSN